MDTNKTHTPGPWGVSHSGFANAPFVVFAGATAPRWDRKYPLEGVTVICEVFHDESPEHREQAGNALLLRAAPDLLVALKNSLGQLYWANIHGSRCEELLGQVKAAIAKAEGGM